MHCWDHEWIHYGIGFTLNNLDRLLKTRFWIIHITEKEPANRLMRFVGSFFIRERMSPAITFDEMESSYQNYFNVD